LEFTFWGIGVILAIVVGSVATIIARNWINTQSIPSETITMAVRMMGIAMALQYPWTLYQGGLFGLQKQVLSNGILASMAALRGLGAVAVLWVSPTLLSYFCWQILVNVSQALLAGNMLWRCLPKSMESVNASFSLFRDVWRYAAGMTGIAILSSILIQMDKIIVSKMLSLEQFGYYSLASLVAQVPLILATPFSNALFPRLTHLSTLGEQVVLTSLYHRTCQFVSVMVLAAGSTLVVFSREVMFFWTCNADTTAASYRLVSLLMVGSMFLAIQSVPFTLSLAHGSTRFSLYVGIVLVMVMVPLIATLVQLYGVLGACFGWIILHASATPVFVHLVHRRWMQGENKKWYMVDVGLPLFAAPIPVLSVYFIMPLDFSRVGLVFWLGLAFLLGLSAAAFAAPEVRGEILLQVRRIRNVMKHQESEKL
jgi:O-antigen/teichoic acid export membrane protein